MSLKPRPTLICTDCNGTGEAWVDSSRPWLKTTAICDCPAGTALLEHRNRQRFTAVREAPWWARIPPDAARMLIFGAGFAAGMGVLHLLLAAVQS